MARHKRRSKEHWHKSLGAPPGTLTLHPDSNKPAIRVIAFGPERYIERSVGELAEIGGIVEQWPVTWVNVDGLGDIDTLREIGEIFHLHPLALEDVVSLHQRPKVEEYENHFFFVVRMLEPGMPIATEQLGIFWGHRFVVTFQEHVGDCLDPVRKRIRENQGRVRAMGADYLAYCLVDAVIDPYFPYLDYLSDRMEDLETEVLERPVPATIAEIHRAKRDIIAIRRIFSPLREAIAFLQRSASPLVTEVTRTYYRDCYDHTIQVLDVIDSHREIASGLLDIYLSSVSNRMNGIMKVLTVMSTLFIPLTFLAGLYGMNYDPDASPFNMPELRMRYGYPALLGVMLLIFVFQLGLYWKKGWLRREERLAASDKDETPGRDERNARNERRPPAP